MDVLDPRQRENAVIEDLAPHPVDIGSACRRHGPPPAPLLKATAFEAPTEVPARRDMGVDGLDEADVML
jgi:hypothetical protein